MSISTKTYTYDPTRSFCLDTETKVEWANNLPREAVAGRPYKRGDWCYYKPTTPLPEPEYDYGGGY